MRVSIIVCTWNRATLLARALESLREAMRGFEAETELIVVDNGSTDATPQVLAEFAKQATMTSVREPRSGLAHARNAGVAAATGDYILWTDDDVQVVPHWLAHYREAFAANPEAAFFGGPIEPEFEGTPPVWLQESWQRVASIYATRDLGVDAGRISRAADLPYGANFALRAGVQRRLHYDPRFGRQPGNYWLGGDETAALSALLAAGHEGWWVPAARVRHWIPHSRQTLRYVLHYGYGLGQTEAMRSVYAGHRRVRDRPLWLWRRWIASVARAFCARLVRGPEVWVPAGLEAAVATGRLFTSPPPFVRPRD